jgi:hypothetical protein
MLHVCTLSAGTNENLHPKLMELFIQFITSRQFLDNNPSRKKTVARNEIYQKVKNKFIQWIETTSVIEKDISAKDAPELKNS